MKSRKNEEPNGNYPKLLRMRYKLDELKKLQPVYQGSGISFDDEEQLEQFCRFYLSADPNMTVHRAKIYSRLALENKKGSKVTVEQFGIIDTLLINKKWIVGGLVLWDFLTVVAVGAILGSFFFFPPLFLPVLLLGGLSWGIATFVIGLFELAKGKSSLMRMIGETNSIVKAQTFINKSNLDDKSKAALKMLLTMREFRGGHSSRELSSSLKEFQKLLEKHKDKVLGKLTVNETGDYLFSNKGRVTATELLNRVYDAELEAKIKGYKNLSPDRKAKARSAYHTALFEQGLRGREAVYLAHNAIQDMSIREAIFASKPTFANWLASSYGAVLLTIASLPLLGIPALLKFKADSVSAVADKEEYFKGKGEMGTTYKDENLGEDIDDDSDASNDERDETAYQFGGLNKKKDEEEDEEEEEEESDSENDDPLGLGREK